MRSNVFPLVERFRSKGLLIDTNLLLVLLVGNVEPRLVGKMARTTDYNPTDYEKIRELIELFRPRIATIPQVLTETGNLLKRNSGNLRFDLQRQLALFIAGSLEARILSKRVPPHPAFDDLGYADTAILKAASGRFLLVTDDGPLQGRAAACGVDTLPFGWLRE